MSIRVTSEGVDDEPWTLKGSEGGAGLKCSGSTDLNDPGGSGETCLVIHPKRARDGDLKGKHQEGGLHTESHRSSSSCCLPALSCLQGEVSALEQSGEWLVEPSHSWLEGGKETRVSA